MKEEQQNTTTSASSHQTGTTTIVEPMFRPMIITEQRQQQAMTSPAVVTPVESSVQPVSAPSKAAIQQAIHNMVTDNVHDDDPLEPTMSRTFPCSAEELRTRLLNECEEMSIEAKFSHNPSSSAVLATPKNTHLRLSVRENGKNTHLRLSVRENGNGSTTVEIQHVRGDARVARHYTNLLLQQAAGDASDGNAEETAASWNPVPAKLPGIHPLEHTHRIIRLDSERSFKDMCARIVECIKVMSIQAKYMDKPASVALLTPEGAELHLALWMSDTPNEVIVEVQRRRGGSMIAHQYVCRTLQAASGNLGATDSSNEEFVNRMQFLNSLDKKTKEQLLSENAEPLQVVLDLLTKDCSDARHLGMESLCTLVNPHNTLSLETATNTSRALLVGSDHSETAQVLQEIILRAIQERSIGIPQETMDEFSDDSDDEHYFLNDNEGVQGRSPEYKEEMALLFNLALDALAHALEVATAFPEASAIVDSFLAKAMDQTEKDVLVTLLQTLQGANAQPHNAWLAAKCLRYVCAASPDAAQRIHDLRRQSAAAQQTSQQTLSGFLYV